MGIICCLIVNKHSLSTKNLSFSIHQFLTSEKEVSDPQSGGSLVLGVQRKGTLSLEDNKWSPETDSMLTLICVAGARKRSSEVRRAKDRDNRRGCPSGRDRYKLPNMGIP